MLLSRSQNRIALVVALTLTTGWAQANSETGPSGNTRVELASFARRLQAGVAAHKARSVAELVAFPLRVNHPNHKSFFLSKSQFLTQYDQVFTGQVSVAVVAQDPEALFENSKGAMFGAGEVWVAAVCSTSSCVESKLLVVSVNVPGK